MISRGAFWIFMTPDEKQQFDKYLASLAHVKRAAIERILHPFDYVAPNIAVIASFSPGFSADLSSWKLRLSVSGIMVQDIQISRSSDYKREKQREERNVGSEFVAQILRRAHELDFWNLTIEDDSMMTDVCRRTLSICAGNKRRSWTPQPPWDGTKSDEDAWQKFMELWDLVHSHAPFPDE